MRATTLCLAVAAALVSFASAQIRLDAALVEPFSYELGAQREPGRAPFLARYERDGTRLDFIAAAHGNDPASATFRLVRETFEADVPAIVVVEGFPSTWGQSPEPILQWLKEIASGEGGQPQSEAAFAAALAHGGGIPFIGGEPDDTWLRDQLLSAGFTRADVFGASAVKALPGASPDLQALTCSGAALQSALRTIAARALADPNAAEAELAAFKAWYRSTFGVDVCGDAELSRHANPIADSIVGRVMSAEMKLRDRHLLGVIEAQLNSYRRVLVVYGGSHWTTLSAALNAGLGDPVFQLRG